jgi:hypothetical protein
MMTKLYIDNRSDAYCLVCSDQCEIQYDSGAFDYEYGSIKGTHSFGEEYTSDCCNAELVEIDGSIFEPEIVQGREEP